LLVLFLIINIFFSTGSRSSSYSSGGYETDSTLAVNSSAGEELSMKKEESPFYVDADGTLMEFEVFARFKVH
jgi:hypothetical protein